MTESDNFLSRWSRRKQEAKREPEPSAVSPGVEQASKSEAALPAADAKADSKQEPQIDLSSLPPIESIGIGTDIRAFLQKGVPLELTRAALRRAWTSDPAIRDFIGLAENQWDFATGKDLPGFGPLEASEEIRRMVAEVFEKRLPLPEEPSSVVTKGAEPAPEEANLPLPEQKVLAGEQPKPDESGQSPSSESETPIVQRKEENIAMQQEPQQSASSLPTKRGHGGALPE